MDTREVKIKAGELHDLRGEFLGLYDSDGKMLKKSFLSLEMEDQLLPYYFNKVSVQADAEEAIINGLKTKAQNEAMESAKKELSGLFPEPIYDPAKDGEEGSIERQDWISKLNVLVNEKYALKDAEINDIPITLIVPELLNPSILKRIKGAGHYPIIYKILG